MGDVMVAIAGAAAAERELATEVHPIVAAANALQVIDAVTFEQAMELGKSCSARIKLVEERLGPSKRKTWEAYQEIMKLMKSFIDPLETAKKTLSSRAYSWQQVEEARKRREAEEARKKAEEETAKKRAAEEEARLILAERLEKNGMKEQATEVLDAPINIPVAEVAPVAPKVRVQGASTRENWQWECIDLLALVRAVASGQIPLTTLTTNDSVITSVVKTMKSETRIPGVRVFDAGTVAFRS